MNATLIKSSGRKLRRCSNQKQHLESTSANGLLLTLASSFQDGLPMTAASICCKWLSPEIWTPMLYSDILTQESRTTSLWKRCSKRLPASIKIEALQPELGTTTLSSLLPICWLRPMSRRTRSTSATLDKSRLSTLSKYQLWARNKSCQSFRPRRRTPT